MGGKYRGPVSSTMAKAFVVRAGRARWIFGEVFLPIYVVFSDDGAGQRRKHRASAWRDFRSAAGFCPSQSTSTAHDYISKDLRGKSPVLRSTSAVD